MNTRGSADSPAAEWLLDNFHIVEEQIREISEDLPPSYYRELPKLADGIFQRAIRGSSALPGRSSPTPTAGSMPRSSSGSSTAYQRVQPLNIGELWAIAITLRITLVENLRRIAEGLARNRTARLDADGLADRLLGVARQKPGAGPSVLLAASR